MTKTKTTKRALFASVLSLLLCVSMLIGSTFAWFTDTATTGVNKIQSGKLDIELVDKDGNSLEGKTLDFTKAEAGKDEAILWEPGCTYNLPEVFVKNNGNLAVKYMILITGINGDAELNEAIEWTIQLDGANLADEYKLAAGDTSKALTISGHMKEDAGNEYQGLTIDGISITVYATQDTVEYDSDDNQYDANANLPVVVRNQAELDAAVTNANGATEIKLYKGTYTLDKNISNKNLTFTDIDGAKFDLTNFQWNYQLTQGTTLTFNDVDVAWSTNNEGYQGFTHSTKVTYNNCNISGTQFMYNDADFVNCTFTTYDGYAVYGRGEGDLNFTDCTFITGGRAIMLYSDHATEVNVVVDNCVFVDNGNYSSKEKAVVETGDNPNVPAKTSKFNIKIKDCVAYGFDTNNSSAVFWGNKDSIPADRLTVTMTGTNTVGTYAADQTSLNSAVAAQNANVWLPAGTYNLNSVRLQNKNLTIAGTKDTVIDMTSYTTYGEHGANLTFDGVTVNWPSGEGYQGITHIAKLTYKNCDINGLQYLYGETVFENCTFSNEQCWSVWTYGSKSVKFTGCTFNTGGHAVLVYNEQNSDGFENNISFDNCIFNNSGTVNEQWGHEDLVETSMVSPTTNTNKYNLSFTNCTVTGSDKQNLWGNKNALSSDQLNVVVNGADVH